MTVERIGAHRCRLGECPVWDAARQCLLWTDIPEKQIWEYCPATATERLFWRGAMAIGGFALTRGGALVLCSDKGVFKQASSGPPAELCAISLRLGERFNDVTTDPAGRIFAGTLIGGSQEGVLYRLEKGRAPVPVITGIGISNGMTFSMDEKTFFHTDSKAMTITRYDYDRDTGRITAPSLFFQSDEKLGLPDGITIDTNDNLWVAFWDGAAVRQIGPRGKIIAEVELPAKKVSSLIFGGAELGDIYITSARENDADPENTALPGGATFRYRSGFHGRPEWPADF